MRDLYPSADTAAPTPNFMTAHRSLPLHLMRSISIAEAERALEILLQVRDLLDVGQ